MKIAIVHDFLTKMGGAENVLLAMHEAFPDAPIYTLLYDKAGTKNLFEKDCAIRTSSLQKYPAFIRRHPKFLFGQFSKAIEEFNFSDYDVVISSSNAFAHGIITSPATFHLCYCHSPMRYVWDWHAEYLKENNIGFGFKGIMVRYLIHNIRLWDKISSTRVDKWLANSKNVQSRIHKYYQKDSTVLYPPVEVTKISQGKRKPEDFY
ncbi:MAG: glycosyltransferase, partial [bacterium]